jgi:hypothetical protein
VRIVPAGQRAEAGAVARDVRPIRRFGRWFSHRTKVKLGIGRWSGGQDDHGLSGGRRTAPRKEPAMAGWTGLRLVGGVSDCVQEPEPPAPLPFAEYAAQLRGRGLATRHHDPLVPAHSATEDSSLESTSAYAGLMSIFDSMGGNIEELADALGIKPDPNHDTDRPRAA